MISLSRRVVPAARILLLLASSAAFAADLNPAALAYKSPDQLKWRDPTGAAGINQAVLVGDPEKPGLYVVMNRFKPGNFSRPHFHPNDRFITVIKGTWWVATGNKFDPNLTVPMPTGSFVTHFAKQVHWDGAKDEEAWLIIVGDGPATLTRVEEAKEAYSRPEGQAMKNETGGHPPIRRVVTGHDANETAKVLIDAPAPNKRVSKSGCFSTLN